MVAAVLISLLMAVAYVAAVIIKDRKLPDSISALVYALPKKWQWVWSIWLILCGGIASIGLIDKLPENFKFTGFLTMALLGFTAAMPIVFKEFHKVHNILGVSTGIMSQVAVMIICRWWLMIWPVSMALIAIMYLNDNLIKAIKGKLVLLSELICAVAVYGTLLL